MPGAGFWTAVILTSPFWFILLIIILALLYQLIALIILIVVAIADGILETIATVFRGRKK